MMHPQYVLCKTHTLQLLMLSLQIYHHFCVMSQISHAALVTGTTQFIVLLLNVRLHQTNERKIKCRSYKHFDDRDFGEGVGVIPFDVAYVLMMWMTSTGLTKSS